MTTDDLIATYSNLLIKQYITKPKASATIETLVTQTVADQIISQVRDGFNVDNAVGAQLDVIGEYRGLSRFIYGFNPVTAYFTLPRISDSNAGTYPGFNRIASAPAQKSFLRVAGSSGLLYTMTDAEFRILIKLSGALANSDFSVKNIDDVLFEFFGKNVAMIDGLDMTITYVDLTTDPSNIFSLAARAGLLPHPAGVRIYQISSPNLPPWFGFRRITNTTAAVGFSTIGTIRTGGFIRVP